VGKETWAWREAERIRSGLSRSALASGHGHIREPHATPDAVATRSPRRGSARAAFSEHTRDAEVAALGWWHASVLGQAPTRERSWEERLEHACEVARCRTSSCSGNAVADAAEARVTAARGLIAARGVDGPEDIDAATRALAACGRAPGVPNRQADLGPCRG
jgi:hypothetical protein